MKPWLWACTAIAAFVLLTGVVLIGLPLAAAAACPTNPAAPSTPAPVTSADPTPNVPAVGAAHLVTFGDWSRAWLASAGLPVTEANVLAVAAWTQAEGFADGRGGGRYNPLNTTQLMPGSTGYNGGGVQNYVSWQSGLDASVKTLRNGLYPGIIAALKRGGPPQTVFNAVIASPWGTKTFAPLPSARAWATRALPDPATVTVAAGADISDTAGAACGEAAADTSVDGLPPPAAGAHGSFMDLPRWALSTGTTRNGAQAVAWAMAHRGVGGYSYQCLRFVDDAYGASNRVGRAIDQWYRAVGAGRGHPGDRHPPIGAQVFWWSSNPARHIAIYVGRGMVVTTDAHDAVPDLKPAADLDSWGPYLGWAEPYYG